MKPKVAKYINIITCFVFAMLVFTLTILSMTGKIRIFSENENRMLEKKPKFSLDNLFHGSYTSDYEKYITDQFVYRDSWISIKTISEVALLKKELNGVYLCNDGYLIEAYPSSDVDYSQMTKNEDRLIEFAEKYISLFGTDRVKIMLIPTASDILRSKLPGFAEVFNQQEVINRVKEKLSDTTFVDVTKALKSHSDEYIFYRTDHHYTTKGAFYSYREWAIGCGFIPKNVDEYNIEEVTDEFRGTIYSKINVDFVKPDSIFLYEDNNEYRTEYDLDGVVENGLYEMSYLETKDKYSIFPGGNHSLTKIESGINNGRRLLIIKDSYADSFVSFAAGHFELVYMMDLRYINVSVSDFIEQNEITDILVLYNVKSFIGEASIYKLVR